MSDKKLLRSCEEISSSSSSSCVGEEDRSVALNGHDIQSLAITAQDLERVSLTPHSHSNSFQVLELLCFHVLLLLSVQLRVPKPPTDSQKPKSMTRVYVRKIRPPDELCRKVRVTVARPLPQDDAPPRPFEYAGRVGVAAEQEVQCDWCF